MKRDKLPMNFIHKKKNEFDKSILDLVTLESDLLVKILKKPTGVPGAL